LLSVDRVSPYVAASWSGADANVVFEHVGLRIVEVSYNYRYSVWGRLLCINTTPLWWAPVVCTRTNVKEALPDWAQAPLVEISRFFSAPLDVGNRDADPTESYAEALLPE